MAVVDLPPVGSLKAGPSTRRWQREFQQWQREYVNVRPSHERLRLPIELDDDVPKAWMTRQLVYEEHPPSKHKVASVVDYCCCSDSTVFSASSAVAETVEPPAEQRVAKLQDVVVEAAHSTVLDDTLEVAAAEKKDAEMRHARAIARQAMHEAERERFAARISEIPAKLAQVQKESTEAREIQMDSMRCLDSENEAKRPTVEKSSRICASEEREAARLAAESQALRNAAIVEVAELNALRELVKNKELACEEAESKAAAAQTMACRQHQINRWSRFCKILSERALCQVLACAESEFLDASRAASDSAEELRTRCGSQVQANARKREELATLSDRAAELETQVERVLTECIASKYFLRS